MFSLPASACSVLSDPISGKRGTGLSLEGTLWGSEEAPHRTHTVHMWSQRQWVCPPKPGQGPGPAPWPVTGCRNRVCVYVHVAASLRGPFCGPTSPSLGMNALWPVRGVRSTEPRGPPTLLLCVCPSGRSSSEILSCGSSGSWANLTKCWPHQLWSPPPPLPLGALRVNPPGLPPASGGCW